MNSQCVLLCFFVLLCFGCSESADEAPVGVLIPNTPSNRVLLRSARYVDVNYTCKHGYVDLRQVPALTFSSGNDAARNSDLVGGIRQLQCSNCHEFGVPETATCVNDWFGDSDVIQPHWTCTAEFRIGGMTIDRFEIDCVIDRASYFQNCVKQGSCILKISALAGYHWSHVLAVTFFVTVIGILVFFGLRYCIEQTRLRRSHSPVPSEDKCVRLRPHQPTAPEQGQSPVGSNVEIPFIDDLEELPSYDQVARKQTR